MSFRIHAALPAAALCLLLAGGCAKKHNLAASYPAPIAQTEAGETGIASWYGHPYHGRAAANGEIYDMEKLTAAHRTLPFGTVVRVTHLANQESVEVRIIDRGPFIDGRVIDLSHAAAVAIHLIGPGTAQVRIDILSSPSEDANLSMFAVQAGSFQDRDRAEKFRATLEARYGSARLVARRGTAAAWRVLVGAQATLAQANALAQRVRSEVGPAFVVRLDQPLPGRR